MLGQLYQQSDKGAPQARPWQGMISVSSSLHEGQAMQTVASTTAAQKPVADKLPQIEHKRQNMIPSVFMSARSSIEAARNGAHSSQRQLAEVSPVRPTETSYRKEAHHFDRFLPEQVPVAGGPKTRNPTGADGSPNGNGLSEGKTESKRSSRLVSNNVNSIAYTSAMVNSNGKTRSGAASHVIAPN